MAKASKGAKAVGAVGADYVQGAWKLIPASFSVDADPPEPPVIIEGRVAVSGSEEEIKYGFPADPVQFQPVEITVGEAADSPSEYGGTTWLKRRAEHPTAAGVGVVEMVSVDVEVALVNDGKVVGGRLAGTVDWFFNRPFAFGSSPLRVTRLLTAKSVAINPQSSTWFAQEPGTWPPAAQAERSIVGALQFGFDTRIHDLSVVDGNVSGGLRVLPAGTQTTNPTATLSRPVDVWGISEDQIKGTFSIRRASIVSSRTADRSPEDLFGKLVFTAPPMKAVAAGTVITYTHKLLYMNAGLLTPFGYLRVESTGASLALVWFANEAVSIGSGEYALNPVRDIHVSKAITAVTITLPAGNWYAARSVRYSPA